MQPIADPLAGYAVTMSVLDIFDHLRATYGTLTTGDIRELQSQLQVFIMADDMATFVSFSAQFAQTIERLETAGQGLRPFQQMECFINSTSNQPNIAKAIEKYVENNPILGNRSLAHMIAYVRINLSNVTSTSAASGYSALAKKLESQTMASKQFEQACADKIAELEFKLAAAVLQSTPGGRSHRNAQPPTHQPNRQTHARPAHRPYCYFHGYFDHQGKVCRIMAKNRGQYSPAMINATSPTDVPGGSTRA